MSKKLIKISNITKASNITINGLLSSGQSVVIKAGDDIQISKSDLVADAQRIIDCFTNSIKVEEVDQVEQEPSVVEPVQKSEVQSATTEVSSENQEKEKVLTVEEKAKSLSDSTSKEALIKAAKELNLDASGTKLDLAGRLVDAGVTEITN